MNLDVRTQSLAELRNRNFLLTYSLVGAVTTIVILAFIIASQSAIIIQETPGMPNQATIEKSSMDKGSQRAILSSVTSNLVQINPSNVEYQKSFVQSYLAPAVYTKISKEMDAKAHRLTSQRELGSYYFVLRQYDYDPKIDKHFVIGEVHTVNAAKDTVQMYVFEYKVRMENYRLWVDDVISYPGERAHDSKWQEGIKK